MMSRNMLGKYLLILGLVVGAWIIVDFTIEHQQFPVGSGAVWNWLLGFEPRTGCS